MGTIGAERSPVPDRVHTRLPGGCHVRKTLAFLAAVCLLSISTIAWTAAQQVQPASATTVSMDEVLKSVRADLQSGRADIVAKNLTLSAAEAAKFWPVFEQYQKEQNAIMDEQMRGLQRYAESYEKLDDAAALAFINTHLDRDAKMVALRQKWLAEFQKVVSTRVAVRAIQIDRRLSLVHQVEFSARLPLVH
jgi:Spy/CpxP family protein refolding chaperone